MEKAIKTAYWAHGKCVRITSGKDVDRACGQAVTHMRRNTHNSHYVEVYDADAADLLHLQIKRSPATGKITIYDRKEDKLKADKFAASPLVQGLLKAK